MSEMLNATNPLPYFHSAKCLFALNEPKRAISSLEFAVEHAAELPEYEELKKQAQAVIKARKKKEE